MADTFENKKDKATLKAEKRAAIKAARDAAKKAAGKEVRVLSTEEKIYNSAFKRSWRKPAGNDVGNNNEPTNKAPYTGNAF